MGSVRASNSNASTDLEEKEHGPDEAVPGAASGSGKKNGQAKEAGHSLLSSVNKIASQIKKPPHRRSASPLNWFPRKKADSFLKRKIKLLQEGGGMNLSLDETLGNANPHYTRIAREKFAAREAARKAMEARKAALVEASWCRILRAARIPSKNAENELEKAEKYATEAFQAATAMGVLMYDTDCPRKSCDIESSSAVGEGSTHTVTASFETAFEVDREVTAAVRRAFILLANCPSSSNKEEFRNLLSKISQNPGCEIKLEVLEMSSECESDANTGGINTEGGRDSEKKHKKYKSRQAPNGCSTSGPLSFTDLVNVMLERLKSLQEDELSSLATIVATSGLNAVLLEVGSHKDHELEPGGISTLGSTAKLETGSRRISSVARFMDGFLKRKEAVTEVPSLDKFLVKHVSRLEREVQEARNSKKSEPSLQCGEAASQSKVQDAESKLFHSTLSEGTSDLGSILVKHVSNLEREVQEAKASKKKDSVFETAKFTASGSMQEKEGKESGISQDLGSILVKHVSKLERDVQEAKLSRKEDLLSENQKAVSVSGYIQEKEGKELGKSQDLTNSSKQLDTVSSPLGGREDKENTDLSKPKLSANEKHQAGKLAEITNETSSFKNMSRIERAKLETLKSFTSHDGDGGSEQTSLDKILVKPVHRLEKEKLQALERRNDHTVHKDLKKQEAEVKTSEGLDKILVKRVSRLEKEKLALRAKDGEIITVKKKDDHFGNTESLDEILVKHQPRFEKAKLAAVQQSEEYVKGVGARKEARERELQEAWGGLSLGNSIRPHLSRLERDRAAWKRAEEEESMQGREL